MLRSEVQVKEGKVILSASMPWKPPLVVEVALNVGASTVLLNVLAPANVCPPVEIRPATDVLAIGITAFVPVDDVTVPKSVFVT